MYEKPYCFDYHCFLLITICSWFSKIQRIHHRNFVIEIKTIIQIMSLLFCIRLMCKMGGESACHFSLWYNCLDDAFHAFSLCMHWSMCWSVAITRLHKHGSGVNSNHINKCELYYITNLHMRPSGDQFFLWKYDL